MRRIFLPGLLTLLVLTPLLDAQAQFGRGRRGGGDESKWWLSGGVGYQWGNVVSDPQTNSNWGFDQSWTTRFTVERSIAAGTTLGVAYAYTRMPLTIQGLTGGGVCARCTAEATLATYGATIRSGTGGRGVHLVYEGFLGALQYSNFTATGASSGLTLPDITNTDFAYSIGIGAGYALARDWELTTTFETLSAIHERSQNLFTQRTARHYALRAGVRMGF